MCLCFNVYSVVLFVVYVITLAYRLGGFGCCGWLVLIVCGGWVWWVWISGDFRVIFEVCDFGVFVILW